MQLRVNDTYANKYHGAFEGAVNNLLGTKSQIASNKVTNSSPKSCIRDCT